jgi:hypothetical protein
VKDEQRYFTQKKLLIRIIHKIVICQGAITKNKMISTVYMHRMRELTTLLPPYLSPTAGNVKSYNPDFSIITAFLPRSRNLMKMSRELSSKKSAHPCPN